MFLNKEHLTNLILDNFFKLPSFEYDQLKDEEKEVIFYAAKNFGFDINNNFKPTSKTVEDKKINYSAILLIRGNFGVSPNCMVEIDNKKYEANLYVKQFNVSNFRFRHIAKELLDKKNIALYPGCDEEWLYESLSDSDENLMYEKLQIIAPKTPIFQAVFDDEGSFKLTDLGVI